jgi:hypothetical protein
VTSLESGGTVVQVDLGRVEPIGVEPALDPHKALPCATVDSVVTVELGDDLVAPVSQRHDFGPEILETPE